MRYASPGNAARIAEELDARDPAAPLPEAADAHTVEGQLADRAVVYQALEPAAPPDA
ncbi:hypothetical protein [Streptomyces sp. NPDC059863]|uniref:hypothetical protein n=1 Tax=unclassified Streptomyces TaxID=2593676 RepID=UPI00364A733F